MSDTPLNIDKIKVALQGYLDERHGAGEKAGGSGHLGFLSIENVNIEDIQRKPGKGLSRYEISYSYDVFVETEFEHTGDANFGKKHYSDKVTMNQECMIE